MTAKNSNKKAKKKQTKETPEVDLHVAPQNGKASREIVAKWGEKEFTDVINPFKATARESFAQRVAKTFGFENNEVQANLGELIVKRAKEADAIAEQLAKEAAEAVPNGDQDRSAQALKDTPEEVMGAAEQFLTNPDLVGQLKKDIKKLGIVGEVLLALTLYVVAVSRKLRRPLGASVQASSSTGKSYVSEAVSSLVPPEDLLQATSITPNALYYMPPGALMHVIVVVGERAHASASDQAEAANATTALREMQSRGRLDKFVPVKTADGGIETKHIVQEGPIGYIDTTTEQGIFEEDATRVLPLTTNESAEQTRAIMKMQARQAAWEVATDDQREQIRQKHQTAQRLLKPFPVCIPYAVHLSLPENRVVARRAFPQLLAVIEAVALLRQRLKTPHPDGHIDADLEDYEIARELMAPILSRTFTPVGERAKKMLAAVLDHVKQPGLPFTRNDCVEWSGVGLTEVRNRLKVLLEAGLVELVDGGKGQACRYKVVAGTAKTGAGVDLPTSKELKALIKKAKK